MKITVIVPTYNEIENLSKLVSKLFSIPLEINLIIVDDHSPDRTGDLADRLAFENPGRITVIHRSGKLGLRTAYLQGFARAFQLDNHAIVQMDADLSHDPQCLLEMAEKLEQFDLVLGSRYLKGGKVDEQWPFWRKALSAWANFYSRSILRIPLRDATTGFRMWRTTALKAMPLDRVCSNGYVFLVEMVYLAYRLGYRIGEVPIYFSERLFGRSKMNFKIQVEAAFRIWRLPWHYRDVRPR